MDTCVETRVRSEREAALAAFALQRPFTITNVKPARPHPLLPFSFILSLLTSFSLVFALCVLSPSSTLLPLTRSPSLPHSLSSRGGTQKNKMFTFNFTFHVPNPFSMSALTSVASAATDAFNSVATDIREDPELLNYMVAGLGPGGVANGFGYDSNRLVKSSPAPSTSVSSPTSPKSKASKASQNRHTVGLGLANPQVQNRKRYLQSHERNHAGFQGSTSGFVNFNPPPGSGTPRFPTQAYSQSSSYSNPGVHGLGQGIRNQLHHPLPASRKRGWVPVLPEPSYTFTNEDFTTGSSDTLEYCNVDEMGGATSNPGFGHDGRGSNEMESGVGDRRKWGEDGNENAMEAGESAFHFILEALLVCFIPLSSHWTPELFCRSLCGPPWGRIWVAHVKSPGNGREKTHFALFGKW